LLKERIKQKNLYMKWNILTWKMVSTNICTHFNEDSILNKPPRTQLMNNMIMQSHQGILCHSLMKPWDPRVHIGWAIAMNYVIMIHQALTVCIWWRKTEFLPILFSHAKIWISARRKRQKIIARSITVLIAENHTNARNYQKRYLKKSMYIEDAYLPYSPRTNLRIYLSRFHFDQ
jgi:hypothetical protein